jgi:hypothetical protein
MQGHSVQEIPMHEIRCRNTVHGMPPETQCRDVQCGKPSTGTPRA